MAIIIGIVVQVGVGFWSRIGGGHGIGFLSFLVLVQQIRLLLQRLEVVTVGLGVTIAGVISVVGLVVGVGI